MPLWLFNAMVAAMPRLQAEEQLRAVEAAQLGSGAMEKKDAQPILNHLMDEAKIGRRRRKVTTLPPRMFAGLNVIHEPAPPAE